MKKRKIARKNQCQGRTAKNKLCKASCQRKYCKRHQGSSIKLTKKYSKYSKNPHSDDDLDIALGVVEGEIEVLCDLYRCEVEGCGPFCSIGRHRRNPSRNFRRFLKRRNPHWTHDIMSREYEEDQDPYGHLYRPYPGLSEEEEYLPSTSAPSISPTITEPPFLPPILEPPFLTSMAPAAPLSLPRSISRNVLLVGGDKTYIPEWLADNATVKQITQIGSDPEKDLGDFFPDVIITFVRAEKPNRPTRETIYNLRNFCQGANSQRVSFPYITFHKGWSQALLRATELGLDWLRDAYPYQTYIPKEELEPAPPRAQTAARALHNEKLAGKFKEKGITNEHVNYAQIRYVKDEESHCVLCGVKIKYQFRLLFDLPGQSEPVIFFPVGSVCITDWMEALPDTKHKLSFLIQARNELMKADEVAAEKKKVSPAKEAAKERQRKLSEQRKAAEKERKVLVAKRKEEKRLEREQRKLEREAKAPKKVSEPAPELPEIGPSTQKKMDDLQSDLWGPTLGWGRC